MGIYDKVHLHIGIPCYGGMISQITFTSFLPFVMMAASEGLNWSLSWAVNDSLVTRARNKIMAKMMCNKKATHFMFIDADIGFRPSDIEALLLADKDVIGGVYPKKGLPEEPVYNPRPGGVVEGELVEAQHVGSGFLMFKRAVYEKLTGAYPQTKHSVDEGEDPALNPYLYAIFDTSIVDGHYMSEDWTFCNRWINIGGQVFAHSKVLLDHAGSYTYRGKNICLSNFSK